MKKFLVALLVLFAVALGSLTVSAAEAFRVDVTGETIVTAGTTVEFKIVVNAIAVDGGLVGADIHMSYDSDFFEVDSVSTTEIDGWNMDYKTATAGVIKFYPAEEDANAENAVTADGAVAYTVKMKVLEQNEKSSSELKITYASGNDKNLDPVEDALMGSLTVTLRQELAAPSGLVWDGSTAKWDAVENASGYSVQAYKAGKEMGDAHIVTGTSFDFKNELKEGGKYTFTVIAVSDQPEYADSEESAQSTGYYQVVGTLATPGIKLTQDLLNGGLEFIITDTNAAGTVKEYKVEIYEKGSDTPVEVLVITTKSGDVPCDGTKIVAGKSYEATVTAVSKDTSTNNNSKKSARTAAVEALEKVVSIKFKTLPLLSYKEGDKLNLSGMVITLTYQSGATKDVAFKDFMENGLTASMENEKELTMDENGQAITVFYGVSISATSPNLTVASGTCAHSNTTTDRKEPTCGSDGYEKITCNDCHITVSDTVLNATGKHTYGAWTVISQPQENIKGYQERYCTACQHRDVAEIPALLPGQTTIGGNTDTPPTTARPDQDDPEESKDDEMGDDENVGSNMNDISRIFLTIVLIIFSLAVLFIVGGVWMSGRRSRARAAQRRRRPPNGRR